MKIIFFGDFDESIIHSDMSVIAGIVPAGVNGCREIQCCPAAISARMLIGSRSGGRHADDMRRTHARLARRRWHRCPAAPAGHARLGRSSFPSDRSLFRPSRDATRIPPGFHEVTAFGPARRNA